MESAREEPPPGPGPIPFVVTRWKCPHCNRGWSAKGWASRHIARCWKNPTVRGCKTCKHFTSYAQSIDLPESCDVGVDLTGGCPMCDNHGEVPWGPGTAICRVCDGEPPKPGPIVHCDLWEAS